MEEEGVLVFVVRGDEQGVDTLGARCLAQEGHEIPADATALPIGAQGPVMEWAARRVGGDILAE